jgi:hypothetical protein
MASVTRLVTFADVDDDVADARRISVSLRHEAVLASGRHVMLLDDRGWSVSFGGSGPVEEPSDGVSRAGMPDIWATTSVEDIVDTARVVVGPDEPFGGRSYEDMAVGHWAALTEVLGRHGIAADALELPRLPHDVVLSPRLLARLGQNPGGAVKS